LFVMLHGCTQNPTDFAAGTHAPTSPPNVPVPQHSQIARVCRYHPGTQMNVLAEKYNFYVLYPEQTSSANANKCWLWCAYDPHNPSSPLRLR